MSQVLPIARSALETLLRHKRLCVLGFFVALGAGTGVSGSAGTEGATSLGDLPPWVMALVVLALLVALAALALHVIAEGALIDAVREERRGREPALGASWRRGLRSASKVFGLKVLTGLSIAGTLSAAVAPALLGALGAVPLALGVALTLVIAIVAVPTMLSLYLAHEVGARMVVLEERGPVDALGAGLRFLRGRLRFALTLLVVDGLAQVATGLVAAPVALAAAGLGLLVYSIAGLVPALVVGTLIVLPAAVVVVGARGTFRSALWTHTYLDERPVVS